MAFLNLNVKTTYSMLNSTIQIDDLIAYATQRRMDVLAIVEDGHMHSGIKFYQKCIAAKIKPIIGVKLTVKIKEASQEWTLFARNLTGYRVLLKLTTDEAINKWVDYANIHPHQQHLIICPTVTPNLDIASLEKPQHFYLGIKDIQSVEVARGFAHLGVPFVYLNEVRILAEDDMAALRVLCAIKQNVKMNTMAGFIPPVFLSKKEAETLAFGDEFLQSAMENTQKIADSCTLDIHFNRNLLPKFPLSSESSATDYLTALCFKGAKKRYGEAFGPHHQSRLQYELSVLDKMGFADYFLIVWDFVKFAKAKEILVGPGRGSAAGSMVAYVLGITGVDPIAYGLLFERFLNPERISLPDIDIDFQDDRRDEVIDYVREKYGAYSVCQIGTFGTFGTRSSWRDTARVHNLDTPSINAVTKQLNSYLSLKDNLKTSQALQKYLDMHPTQQQVYKLAMTIEGLPRHVSTHAAGVIISPADLRNFTALTTGGTNSYLSQYEAGDLESIGLLKMDFLGLRNLTMIKEITAHIHEQIDDTFDVNQIPLDDASTYQLIATAKTTGIFQLESSGMRAALRQIEPSNIEDIISVLALFRPGPMANIGTFAARKHGRIPISYDHPSLEPILNYTYGIIVYQEQIMQIASLVAGYSLGEADVLRRAISKKETHIMAEEEQLFLSRAIKRNYPPEVAKKIFQLILRFADYGFNRSHAASYAMISYQMAYLKANYPQYFMVSVLRTQMGSARGTAAAIKEAKNLGINVLPPSVKHSMEGYHMEEGGIRIGFLSIKQFGWEMAQRLVAARNKKAFHTWYDFVKETIEFLGEKNLANLIDVGACDDFGYDRQTLHKNIETVKNHMQYGIIAATEFVMEQAAEETITQQDLMAGELALLGFYLQTHPIQLYEHLAEEKGWILPALITATKGNYVSVLGFVNRIREIKDKNGNLMAFMELSDDTAQLDVTIFSSNYDTAIKQYLNQVVVVKGKISQRQDKISLNFDAFVTTFESREET